MRKWLLRVTLVLGLAGLILAGVLIGDYHRFRNAPLNLHAPMLVQIEKGAHQQGVVRAWQAQGLLDRPHDALWLRIWSQTHAHANNLLVGEYELLPGRSLLQTLQQIRNGEVHLYEFTIVEGWNFREFRAALAKQEHLRHISTEWNDTELMSNLGWPERHPEGRFLPETYAYTQGSTDVELLKRSAAAMEAELAEVWQQRAEPLPINSADEALILASIVEKETGRGDERPLIAGVFVKRLNLKMRLQTDPTVIYGLGENFDGNIRRRDLRADTPYNTYTRFGLPPTPIALPGKAALRAAVQPLVSDKLFFVARGDGSHQFSATLQEHEMAIRAYQLK